MPEVSYAVTYETKKKKNLKLLLQYTTDDLAGVSLSYPAQKAWVRTLFAGTVGFVQNEAEEMRIV